MLEILKRNISNVVFHTWYAMASFFEKLERNIVQCITFGVVVIIILIGAINFDREPKQIITMIALKAFLFGSSVFTFLAAYRASKTGKIYLSNDCSNFLILKKYKPNWFLLTMFMEITVGLLCLILFFILPFKAPIPSASKEYKIPTNEFFKGEISGSENLEDI